MITWSSAFKYASPLAAPLAFSRQDRWQYVGVSALGVVTLGIARWLQPSPLGHGTHRQLGLPPCSFLQWTGYPCPSCGLTTSFAHAAHFEFGAALLTQPFGFLAFWLTLLAIPGALYLARRRVSWQMMFHHRVTTYAFRALLVLYLLGWAYKLWQMRGVGV